MEMLGRALCLVVLSGWGCGRPECTDYTTFQAKWFGVNVTGFEDQACIVTFSRPGSSAAYTVPTANGGAGDTSGLLGDAMLAVTPGLDASDSACVPWTSTDVVACTSAVGLPPAACARSSNCLNVTVSGQDADRLAASLGGTDYHVTVTCGGVLVFQTDDNAHGKICGA
jgi:hypothetical protein